MSVPRVSSSLDDARDRRQEAMTLTREHGNTVLSGTVRDQAELHGLFQRVSDLGLTLLSVVAVEEAPRR